MTDCAGSVFLHGKLLPCGDDAFDRDRCCVDGCDKHFCEEHAEPKRCEACGVNIVCDRHAVMTGEPYADRCCPECAAMSHLCQHDCGKLADQVDDTGAAVCRGCADSLDRVAAALRAIQTHERLARAS